MVEEKNAMLNNTLRQVPLFAQLKDDELRCVEQGEELWLSPGEEFITDCTRAAKRSGSCYKKSGC